MRRALPVIAAVLLAGCTAFGPPQVHGDMRYSPPDGFVHHDIESSDRVTTWTARADDTVRIQIMAVNHSGAVDTPLPANATPSEVVDRYLQDDLHDRVRDASAERVALDGTEWIALNATVTDLDANRSQFLFTRSGPTHIHIVQLVAPPENASMYYPAFRDSVAAATFD